MNPSSRRDFLQGAAGAAAFLAFEPELLAFPARLRAPVKLAIVGCGRQARALLGELAKFPDVTVAALCDVDASRLRSAERRAQGAKTYDAHEKLLEAEKDLQAVIVATPTHRHEEIVVAALAAGKHVYCEAPMASTIVSCKSIARAARGTKQVVQVGLLSRTNPVYTLARSFVRSGSIRDLVAMQAHFRRKDSWRATAADASRDKEVNWKLDPEVSLGLIGEVGTHQFDVLQWFTGQYPVSVSAGGDVLAWKDGRTEPDTAHCLLSFPGKQVLTWEATLGNSFEGQYEVLAGTMGAIKLAWSHGWMFREADAPTEGWQVYANRQKFHNDEGITLIADATKLASQGKLAAGVGLPNPSEYYALEAFLKSVTEGAEVACSADDGLRAAAVAIHARQAQKSGETVAIDPKSFEVQ
jgi:predicted dehydrogenase